MKNNFKYWLTNIAKKSNGEKYSPRTIYKYCSSIDVIKRQFDVDLWNYENIENLFKLKTNLYNNEEFMNKNTTGNRMYSRAVETFIDYVCDQSFKNIQKDIGEIENNVTLSYEERDGYIETVCNVRNPQFQKNFRDELLNEFEYKCALCEIDDPRFLIASHIIPYSRCVNKSDMYRSYNGLLLCIIHDALFDRHLITFNDNGSIIINKTINESYYDFFKIKQNLCLESRFLTQDRKNCLLSHKNLFDTKNNIYN